MASWGRENEHGVGAKCLFTYNIQWESWLWERQQAVFLAFSLLFLNLPSPEADLNNARFDSPNLAFANASHVSQWSIFNYSADGEASRRREYLVDAAVDLAWPGLLYISWIHPQKASIHPYTSNLNKLRRHYQSLRLTPPSCSNRQTSIHQKAGWDSLG